jgi:hypothetical protein
MSKPASLHLRPSAKELLEVTRKCLRGAPINVRDRVWSRTPHLDLRTTPRGLTRGLEIYQALIRALEPAGIPVSLDDGETLLGVGEEKLSIAVRERTARRKYQPSEKEIRDARLGIGLPLSDRWEFVPTGDFFVNVDAMSGWHGGKQWVIRTDQSLEGMIPTIVSALPGLAIAKRVRREEQERWTLQYEAERQAKFAEQVRQAAERARLDALLNEVSRWQQASAIRSFCSALVGQAGPTMEGELEAWVSTSLSLADKLDPLPARIASSRALAQPPL